MATQPIPEPHPLSGPLGAIAATRVPVEEYLRTAYRPDCDYVDGEIQERNLGERDHSTIQKRLIILFGTREAELGIEVFPEQRVQVSANRFRVPDVVVVVGKTDEQILTRPPFLCIEILSPEDRMTRVRQRVDDYLAMGVLHIWVLDPAARVAYQINQAEGWREVKQSSLKTSNPELEIPLTKIFA